MRALLVAAFLALALGSSPALAEEPGNDRKAQVDDLLAKMAKAHEGLNTLSASFTQTSSGISYPVPFVQKGTLELEVPGKMRWEFAGDTPTTWVSDGATLWVLDPTEKTCTKYRSAAGAITTYFGFLTGSADPRELFRVSPTTATPPVPDAVGLELKPKEADGSVEAVRLWLDGGTHRVTALTMLTPFGDATRMVLEDVKTPDDLPDDRFVWEGVEGWRVIEGD